MSDGREPEGREVEAGLGEAFRRADAEARPRPGFRDDLRARFVAGDLAPREGPPARVLPIPRWLLYPAAAAVLLGALALSGALDGRAPEEPITPVPEGIRRPEQALAAAAKRVGAVPALAGTSWQHRVVEGRPWLLPGSEAYADGKELRVLGSYMAKAEEALSRNLPGLAARPANPVVTLAAPSREAFEALAGPLMAPMEVGAFTVAFALREQGVLLLSPEALAPGGPPCEEMYILHEAAHAWLNARCAGGARLPLWADEGLAGAASAGEYDIRGWCRQVIAEGRKARMDPFTPEEVLAQAEFGAMARLVASRAPRPDDPYTLVILFGAHAEGLVLFLTDEGDPARAGRFVRWLGARLDGKPTDPAATARDLGFESVEALFAARDAWLGL